MSNKKKEQPPKSKSEILSELDRLKELLEKDRYDSDDDDIPVLSDIVEIGDEVVPTAEEVATSGGDKQSPSGGKLPTGQELNKLIDMLVTLQLRKLRPVIQKEVVRQVLERYPDLK